MYMCLMKLFLCVCVVNVCVWCIVVEARGHWVYSSITLCLCPWIDRVSYFPSRPWFCLDWLFMCVPGFQLRSSCWHSNCSSSLSHLSNPWRSFERLYDLMSHYLDLVILSETPPCYCHPSSLALYYLSSYYCPCSLVRVMTILLVTIVLQRCWVITAYCAWHFKVYLINKITDL